MRKIIPFISTVCLLVLTPFSQAQEFPNRPVTFVVPSAAGGAGGTIGAARAAKALPNGYTPLFHNMGHAAAPALHRTLSDDPLNDFEPLGSVADVPMILVGRKTSPPNTLAELIHAGSQRTALRPQKELFGRRPETTPS